MKKILTTIIIFTLFLSFSGLSPIFAASASSSISAPASVNTSGTFTVTIAASASEAFNGVEFNITTSNLTITKATASGTWSLVGSPISYSANSARFAGASTGPQSGSKTVMTLTIRAGSVGSGTISASGKVAIVSNSTEVSTSTSRNVQIAVAPTAAPTPKPAAGGVVVTSTTHPDQNKWYTTNSPIFSWVKDGGVIGFSFAFDNSPATEPDNNSEGSISTTTFSNQANGTFYFHIKAQNDIGWGPATHFKVNIDKLAPEPFTITAQKNDDAKNYSIFFSTNDKNSGIANYSVEVDGQNLGNKTSDFTVLLSTKEIKVTASDLAGNIKESILKFNEAGALVAPTIESQPKENNNTTQINSNANNDSTNLWLIVLAIISSLLLIYAITMTALYLKDKGHFKKFPKADNKKQVPARKTELNPKSDLGLGDSPLR